VFDCYYFFHWSLSLLDSRTSMSPKFILLFSISKGDGSLQIILFIFSPSLLYKQADCRGADNLDASKEKKRKM